MRFFSGKFVRLLAATLLAGTCFGCGSASNNDQGAGLTFFGFFSDAGQNGVTYVISPLSESDNEGGAGVTGDIAPFLGFKNNLLGQYIRLQRVYFEYVIAGASATPPNTNVAFSVVLGSDGPAPEGSSIPPGFVGATTAPSVYYASLAIVPEQIRAWLNLNRGSLPDLPFDMEVIAYARGITSGGDSIDSNLGAITIRFTPDQIITPTDGSTGSSSDGSDSAAADEIASE